MAKGFIPDEQIAEIRERTPIEEIVGEYVQLTPAGHDSLKGLSPFKDEKTPSFHVRPNHGYFHDFSSGKGGDVFTFLMEVEHLSFPEAVQFCADKIGYHISYQGGGPTKRAEQSNRQRLIAVNQAAHAFYREQLETAEAAAARDFLLQRGFSREHIYQFECGYAPQGWDATTKYLLGKRFTFDELKEAGVSTMGKRGPIDRFHGRLIWPIKGLTGDVIGFGARKLYDDDNLGKYMNTPETPLYKKSKVLFGLDQAKRHIAEGRQAVIVEGYTDVMAMHAAGIPTAVAACGTAFGAEHLQVLRRFMRDDSYFRGEIIYTFDGDEAGQKAALRAFEGSQEFSGQSFVAVAPAGMDPCDLRLARGDAAVRDLVARREPIFEFVARTHLAGFNTDTVEGRISALRRVTPVLAGIRDAVLRREYARRLAGWVGWDNTDEVVRSVERQAARPQQRRELRRVRAPQSQSVPQRPAVTFPSPGDSRLWPEREAVKLSLQRPDVVGDRFDALSADALSNEAYRLVFEAIVRASTNQTGGSAVEWITAVSNAVREPVLRSFIAELAVEPIQVSEERLPSFVDSVLARVQEAQVSNQIAILKARMERMQSSTESGDYRTLFEDLIALEVLRKQLSERAMRA